MTSYICYNGSYVLKSSVLILCFFDGAFLYNIVNKANFVHKLFLVYVSISTFFFIFLYTSISHERKKVNLYMFRATMFPSSGETTVFMLGTCYSVWMTVYYA